MKRRPYIQMALTTFFFGFAYLLPTSTPTWLFCAVLTCAIVFAAWLGFAILAALESFNDFQLSNSKLEQLRTMHRLGDG